MQHPKSHLSQIDLVQHDNGGASIIIHQPPEVLDGVGQGMLGHDERGRLSVALRDTEHNVLSADTRFVTLTHNQDKDGSVFRMADV